MTHNRKSLFIVLLGLVFVSASLVLHTAERADGAQPYGGCAEAIDYPQSKGADWCRNHGYKVTSFVVVSPDKFVLAYDMPRCKSEDQATGPCRWNFGKGHTGNDQGKKFYVGRKGHVFFVKGVAA